MVVSRSQLVAAAALLLACVLALPNSSYAQSPRGEEGTGGAAGYSPPVDMPDANAPMLEPVDRNSRRGGATTRSSTAT